MSEFAEVKPGLRRAYRHAYATDLWNLAAPRIEPDRLESAEEAELERWFLQAHSTRDLGEVARIGLALQSKRPLRPGERVRLSAALVRLGRVGEAVAMGPGVAKEPLDLLATVAAGRLRKAREQFAGVQASSDPQMMRLLGRTLDGPFAPAAAWDADEGPIAAALELGCGDFAARLAAKALGRGPPSIELWEAALELMQASFRMASPDAAAKLLEAAGPLYAGPDRPAYDAVRRLSEGGDDDGPVMEADLDEAVRFPLAYLLTAACAAIGRPDAALRRLCRFSAQPLSDTEHLFEMARLVGVAEPIAPRFAEPIGRRRIFDVFPFNGEFDLLDLKLEAMADKVDAFVLVEAPRTFTDNPKPLYFQDAKDRYAAYGDKIVHVIAEDAPGFVQSTWAREYHQRNQGVRGLSGLCAPEDLVLISDVDEIVDTAVLERMRRSYATIGMRTFMFFFNYERVADRGVEHKTGVAEARLVQSVGLAGLRVGMWAYSKETLNNGGWHFSMAMSSEDIKLKLMSYAHEEHQATSLTRLQRQIDQIRGGKQMPGFERVPIDESFPEVLRGRPERYAGFILDETAS